MYLPQDEISGVNKENGMFHNCTILPESGTVLIPTLWMKQLRLKEGVGVPRVTQKVAEPGLKARERGSQDTR